MGKLVRGQFQTFGFGILVKNDENRYGNKNDKRSYQIKRGIWKNQNTQFTQEHHEKNKQHGASRPDIPPADTLQIIQ